MILNQTAEYALRGMAVLATRGTGQRVTSQEISELAHIPPHYVSKVMRRLVRAKLVTAQRGHGGGFALAVAPDQVTLLQILEAAEFEVEQSRCAFGFGRCDTLHPCPLHPAFSELNASFIDWACRTTLATAQGGYLAPAARPG